MKTLLLCAVFVLSLAALMGAHHMHLIRLPLGPPAPAEHVQTVPFDIHYPPREAAPLVDEAGKAMIGRTLDRHKLFLRHADVYMTPRRHSDPYGQGHSPYGYDTSVSVSLEASMGIRLSSRTDLTRRHQAAETACAAIERCMAALMRVRTDPDLKGRMLSVISNL